MILQGRNLTQGLTGIDVATLQSELTTLGYTIPATEQQGSGFGAGTLTAVQQFQTAQNLTSNGTVDTTTAAALTTAIKNSTYVVSGTVSSPTSAGVGALAIQLVDRNIGADQVLATSQLSADGTYSFSQVISPVYLREHRKALPDLQTRIGSGSAILAASAVSYDAPLAVTLDIVLPAGAPGMPS
jgi:hypothetical protein